MNRFICCLLLITSFSTAFSQKEYFIYLQSEAEQQFFVKMSEKVYSSAPSGYLILSKMKDSSYTFKIGFPQNKWPEQQFSVDIKAKDQGFLVKNFGEKGWGLFDLQTMGVQMSTENSAKDKAIKKELKEISAFTEILSKAANDPSLREKPVFAVVKKEEKTENVQPAIAKGEPAAVKEEKTGLKEQPVGEPKTQIKKEEKAENVQPSIIKEDPAVVREEKIALKEQPVSELKEQIKKEDPSVAKEEVQKKEVSPALVKEEVIPKKEEVKEAAGQKEEIKTVTLQEYKKSVVVKKSESSTTDGFGLTFVDQYDNGQRDTIHIVIPKPVALTKDPGQLRQDEKQFLDITTETKEVKAPVAKNINSCTSTASESDFIRLRKRMAAQMTEEAMINEAKRGFKTKCFTTEQIKHLGSLFRNEPARFQFFEAAYPYSKDRENFAVLQDELKENYFIYRFKNLLKSQ